MFGKDIGFYLFSLPAYVAFKNSLAVLPALAAPSWPAQSIRCTATSVSTRQPWSVFARGDRPCLRAARRLFRDQGLVLRVLTATCCSTTTTASSSAPSYTDVHVELPALWLLIVLAAVAAIVAFGQRAAAHAPPRHRQRPCWCSALRSSSCRRRPGARSSASMSSRASCSWRDPYIERNIALTREAYNLGEITVKPFPAEQDLTFQSLQSDSGDRRQHPAMGLAAAVGHLRATAGNPHLLPVPRRRRRPLPSRRPLSAGDALGARALPFAAVRPTPRPGSTCISSSPTATGW